MYKHHKIHNSVLVLFILGSLFISCKGPQGPTGPQGPSGNEGNVDLNKGLLCYFPFSGNANDASGNGFNGIVHGATLTTDRFGNSNSAYSFNGIDNYIDLGDILDSVFCRNTALFSISGWAKTKVMGSSTMIIGKNAGGSGPYQWSVSHNSGAVCATVASDSSAQNYQIKYITMGIDVWFHFVLIFNGNMPLEDRLRLYVNTNSEMYYWGRAGTLGTTTQNTNLHLTIGAIKYNSQAPYSGFNGVIDDIRIYNRVLTLPEIQALYFANN